jgi:hypothetical protein
MLQGSFQLQIPGLERKNGESAIEKLRYIRP